MASNQTEDQVQQAFSGAFFDALASAFTEASGSPWTVTTATEAAEQPDDGEPFWVSMVLDGDLAGNFLLEFRRAEAALLGSQCMRQPLAEFSPEHSQALLQAVEATTSTFCASQAENYGAFAMNASVVPPPEGEPGIMLAVTVADGDGKSARLAMYLTPSIAEALRAHAVQEQPTALTTAKPEVADAGNLGLVMNVELNVTLRFGQRKLTLREVLDLTSGSVIELDRQVEEPIELLLDGKVIARGEAVVIDGNYGLRVTEVPKPISSASLR